LILYPYASQIYQREIPKKIKLKNEYGFVMNTRIFHIANSKNIILNIYLFSLLR